MPRSSTWAAAARPTGPAPRMATVLVLLASVITCSCSPRIIEIVRQKNSGSFLRQDPRHAGAFAAAFLEHVVDQAAHEVVVGVADEGRSLARLADEADPDQRLEMMRQRRGGDADLGLQPPDRQAFRPRAPEGAIDLQAGRVTQCFQACGGVVEVHGSQINRTASFVNGISRNTEL